MNRKHILAFLRYFLPLTGIIVLVSYFYADSQRAVERSHHEAAEQLNVRLGAGMLDRRLLIVGRDLRLLASSQALKRYLEHGDTAELGRIAEDFLAFAEARAAYDQIRLLDPAGQELVQIEHDGQQARIRPAAALQNMAERDDFRDSIGLPAGRIAVSPLDLNVENGQVALPSARPCVSPCRWPTAGAGRAASSPSAIAPAKCWATSPTSPPRPPTT